MLEREVYLLDIGLLTSIERVWLIVKSKMHSWSCVMNFRI
jgi:hypothetical protein